MDKYAALVAKGLDAYLAVLTEIGWFKLSHNFKAEVQSRLEEIQDPQHYQSALAHLAFDAEGFESGGAYESLLEEILEVLDVDAAEYQAEDDGEVIQIHLKIDENTYEYQVRIAEHEDWLDQNFIHEFINSVAEAENMESRFFCLPPSDQTIEFVFVPEKMYTLAVERGLIPEEMEYFMEEGAED